MDGEWESVTWGDLATLEYGKGLRTYGDTPNVARVFGTNGPIGWHSEPLWHGPGVIVGRKGAYRGVHYTEKPYWVIDTAYSLQPKEPINLRWAYYQLRTVDLNNVNDGSPIPSTTRPAFYALPVAKPPRAEQDRIAEVLGVLDEKIELNRRMAKILEAMARAVFRSWFVDFDPVHAKAEGRPTSLPDNLAALFPARFGDDGLPEGWELTALQTGLTRSVVRGISPSYAPQGVLVLNQKCIRDGRVDFSKARYHDPASKRIREERLLASGDVVINSTGVGTLGRVAQVRRPPEPTTADSHVTIVKPNEYEISPNLFGLALIELQPLIETLGQGSTGQTELSRESVAELKVVMASEQVRRAFDDAVVPLRDRADLALAEARSLGELRDTLLPKLISGELRIAEAEKKVSAA